MKKALLFIVIIFAISSPLEAKRLWAKSFIGKKAPKFEVEAWVSKKTRLNKKKFLLIDFWATWCGPCRQAIPKLNGFAKKYKKQLEVVGISNEPKHMIQKMKKPIIKFHSTYDTKQKMAKQLAVAGFPHVIIVNPKGIVVWEGCPYLKGHELTEEVIEKLLAEK